MDSRRLLILDDDPMVGKIIQRIAQLDGVEAQFTSSSSQFFQLLHDWQPTHIALDLVMPGMDGVQVMAQMAELSCRARIIITSGVGSRVLAAAGRAATEHGLDIVGVLAKPFSPAHLRDLLQAAIALAPRPRTALPLPALTFTAADLCQALDRRQLVMVYQPKIVCQTGALDGFEALVRWQHPDFGLLPADDFIPLAETCGLIDALTDQIIKQSLDWFACFCHGAEGARLASDILKLSLNISARTLGNGALFERVRQQCENLRLSPNQLIFELTETSAMDDPVASLELLTRLRMMGYHLSIDDFGTGFSSMLQLVRLPFSEIKVDKSFVMTAMTSQESRTVVKFIVDLGHNLGLRCTAEGVESADTLAYLRTIGCDLAQGYHIARPMPGDKLAYWIADRYG